MENNSLIISYMKFSLQECVFFPIQKIVIFKTDFPCPINDAFSTRKKKSLNNLVCIFTKTFSIFTLNFLDYLILLICLATGQIHAKAEEKEEKIHAKAVFNVSKGKREF